MEEKKNKVGRPAEPVSEKVDFDQLVLLCEKGFTDEELAKFYKVSRQTIHNWKKDLEFNLHLKKGKESADNKVERSLFERATGYSHPEDKILQHEGKPVIVPTIKHYPPDTVAAIFWLKNRKPTEWREAQELKHTGELVPPPPLAFKVAAGVTIPTQESQNNEPTGN